MKKNKYSIKFIQTFAKCMSLATFLTFSGTIEAATELTYAQQTIFSVSMENQTLKSVINWVEKNSQFIFIYRTNVDLSCRVNVDVRNKTVEEILKQMLADTHLKYYIRDRQVIICEADDLRAATPQSSQQNQVTITGTVTDTKGESIIGANILEKGTTNGTITDIEGRFTLKVPQKSVLTVSYIGFLTQEVTVGNHTSFKIQLKEDAKALAEVVVTAFGIKREEKALGYAVQKVKGDQLATVKSVDLASSLTGKVAGMNIKNSTEFNTAPTVQLRGESPLIVVDGVPYSNISLRDISSDDVESIDVLKGATASALYGARGGSGAIMITTKKGDKEGLDVTINSSTMFNAGYLAIPDAQHSYSSGTGGKYDSKDYVWGDKLDIGRTANQYNPNTYAWEEMPLTSKGKNNFRNFLEQGLSTNNNVSIAWRGKNGGFRTSLNHVYSKGQYPNETLNKITYSINGNMKLGKLMLEGGAIWNKRFYPNDRGSGYGGGGYIYNMIVWTGSDYDVRDYRNYWVEGKEHYQQNWRYTGYYDNPYFLAYECTNANDYDKLNTYAFAKYDILPWLNFSMRTGIDFYASRTERKNPISTIGAGNKNGSFSVSKGTGYSTNSDFILAANHDFGDFTVDGIAGSTIYYYYDDSMTSSTSNGLSIPGYYSLKATKDPISGSSTYKSKRVNSVFGKLSMAWRNLAFIDVAGRNDWSSTLPEETRSYFYPSASGSLIMSEFIDLPKPFTFWKLRGSWTVTKSDLDIFEIQQAYSVSTNVWDKMNTASYPTSMRSATLQPTTARSYEIGTAFNVWENRLRFDVSYYNKLKYNLTRNATISSASGFSNTLINYQEEQERRGVEVTIGADVIKGKDWNWTVNANWALDRFYYSQIDPVYSTQNEWVQSGLRWDWLATTDWERDSQGNMILYNGLPQKSKYKSFVGYEYPDWIWGVNSTLSYKNWSLSIALDGRVGGTVYNQTEQAMWNSGSHPDSDTSWRYDEVVNNKVTYVAPGVKIVSGTVKYDTDGRIVSDTRVFAPNDVAVSYQNFTQTYQPWSGGAAYQNYRSTTFLKIRELSVTYNLPQSACDWSGLKGASVSFIGQNLMLWAKEFKYADPDVDKDDLSSPSQRFLGFNVRVNF